MEMFYKSSLVLFSLYHIEAIWTDVYISPEGESALNEHPAGDPMWPQWDETCLLMVGGDVLESKMLENIPNAKLQDGALLRGYRPDFGYFNEEYKSTIIIPQVDCGYDMFGVVYYITADDFSSLQSSYSSVGFYPKLVNIEFVHGNGPKECYTFIMQNPLEKLGYGEILPWHKRPSLQYMALVYEGLMNVGIPQYYLDGLSSIPFSTPPVSLANEDVSLSTDDDAINQSNN